MPITEWTEPIYLLQKGENKRANCYFQRWLDYEGSTRKFVEYLQDLWNQNGINLESHFHKYDINKNKPPSLSTILKLLALSEKSIIKFSLFVKIKQYLFTHI